MKVLQIINNLDIGGAEILLKNYISSNDDISIKNDVCLLNVSNTFILDQLKEKNINIFNLKLNNKYSAVKAIKEIKSIISQNNYDCVHVHLFPCQYYGAKLSDEFKDIHFIFTEHSTFNKRRNIKCLYPIEKWSYSKYEKIICISRMTAASLESWMPSVKSKLSVVYGGIIINDISRNEKPFYDAVLVGSLRGKEKGADIFIKSIKAIENSINKVAIVGDGILKGQLISLRDDLKLTNKIDFIGNTGNVYKYLSNSKMFVLPSRWEGFGLAILEAMSAHLPIIASDIGGIPEIITNGKDGILVPADDIKAFSQSMLYVLNNKNKAMVIGENAYNTVANKFSIEAYTYSLNKLYKDLMK